MTRKPTWPPQLLHQRIAEQLRQEIATLQPGSELESEERLAHRLHASRTTVRRALETLRKEGVLVTVPKSGTFVAPTDDVGRGSKERAKGPAFRPRTLHFDVRTANDGGVEEILERLREVLAELATNDPATADHLLTALHQLTLAFSARERPK